MSSHPSIGSKYIVTLGSRGARYLGKVFPVETREVFDVCGAGDVFLSSLIWKYLNTENIENSISYANCMASISVGHMGTYILQKKDII